MPLQAPPIKLTCRACGWHHVYRSRSDVVMVPGACLACGSEDLDTSIAGPLDGPGALAAWVLDRLRGRSRPKR